MAVKGSAAVRKTFILQVNRISALCEKLAGEKGGRGIRDRKQTL